MTVPSPPSTMISLRDFATAKCVNPRTVRKWQERNELPTAVMLDGKWWIPEHAERVRSTVAVRSPRSGNVSGAGGVPAEPEPLPSPLGTIIPLAEAAEQLKTTVGGVKRMIAAGLYTAGPFGPRGIEAIYLPPRP